MTTKLIIAIIKGTKCPLFLTEVSVTQELVNQIKQATAAQINKKVLYEKIQADLHFAYAGGMFKVDPALYSFVASWQGDQENFFLEDVYCNPVKVDPTDFLHKATEHYQMVMNRWHTEYQDIARARKI